MGQVKPASSRSSKTPRRSRQVGLACGAVNLQSGRRYAKRNRRLLPLLWPQGAHRPVLTARFPLQGALQTLPVTGREPDMLRSPQTTPPRELLTPAGRERCGSVLVQGCRQRLLPASQSPPTHSSLAQSPFPPFYSPSPSNTIISEHSFL